MSSRSSDGVVDRRAFIGKGALAGAGALAGGGAIEALLPSLAAARGHKGGVTKGDLAILGAAQIAEALAVTTYTGIIDSSPFFGRLASDDQGYLEAARQEEMAHYLLERSVTRKPAGASTFYYPPKMFDDAQTTLNVLVTLEDAFIAAYLVGRAQVQLGRPARHRRAHHGHRERPPHARARRRPRRRPQDGGPIEKVTGIQGKAESVDPPNNNTYERTLRWTDISKAVAALTPFIDKRAAARAGFDTSRPFTFKPFTPSLPGGLGDFHSFVG